MDKPRLNRPVSCSHLARADALLILTLLVGGPCCACMEGADIGRQQAPVALRQLGPERGFDRFKAKNGAEMEQDAQHDHIDQADIAALKCQCVRWNALALKVVATKRAAKDCAVNNQQSTWLHERFVFLGGGQVERNDGCWIADQG